MTQEQAASWLKFGAAFVVVFGLLMAAASVQSLAAPVAWMLDLVFFPLDGAQTMADPVVRLLSAICGGVMVGWGAMIWLLVARLLPRDPTLVRQLILTGICAWFVVDSTGSVLSGGHWNVLGNLGFLLLFVVPAAQLRKQ